MKKKNIRKYILEAIAGLLVIGACFSASNTCRTDAYASVTEFRGGIAPSAVDAQNGDSEVTIKGNLPLTVGINVAVDGAEETWENAVAVTWGDLNGYDASRRTAYDVTCIGTLQSGTVTKPGSSETVSVPDSATVSATIHIAAATCDFRNAINPSARNAQNGESEATIKRRLPSTVSINVAVNGTNETWRDCASISSWGDLQGYDSSRREAYDVTCTGTLASGPVSHDGMSVTIPSSTTVSATIHIAAATTYSFDEVVAPAPSNAASSDSETAIIGRLPSRLSIKVTPSNSSSQETWPDIVPVTWSTVTTVSSSVKNCSGTVAAGNYTYSGKTTNISRPQSVTAVINIVSDYDQLINNYSTSLLATDTNGDITIDVDISDSKKKDILKYVLNHTSNSSLKSAIQNALLSNNTKITMVFKAEETSPGKTPKEEMKKEVEKKSGAAICTYFDLTLKIKIGDNSYEVNDIGSSNSVKFKIKVPEDERKSSRKYNAVRYHDNDADMLNDSYKDLDDKKFSFSTYLFSDYAISYTDSSSSSSSSSASTPKSNSAIVPGDDGTGAGAGGTDKSKTPKTGDDFNPRIWIYLLIVCATVASAAWILLQDTKDEKKDKG